MAKKALPIGVSGKVSNLGSGARMLRSKNRAMKGFIKKIAKKNMGRGR